MRRAIFPLVAVLVVLLAASAEAAPGDLDTSFGGDGLVGAFPKGSIATAVAVDPGGRIVVVGYTLDGHVDVAVARFLADGTPDPAFGGGDGRVRVDLGGADYAFDLALDAGGGMAIAGQRTTDDADVAFVVRLGHRGAPTSAFGGGDGIVTVDYGKRYQGASALAFTPKGRLVLGGFTSNGATSRSALARLMPDGRRDGSFSNDGLLTLGLSGGAEQVNDLLVLQDGWIVAAGYAEVGLQPRFSLMRVRGRGVLDATFGTTAGFTLTNLGPGADIGNALTLQPDGKLVLVGSAANGPRDDWGLARYGFRGRPDPTFDRDGILILPFTAAAEEATGVVPWGSRLVVAGRAHDATTGDDLTIVRLKSGGGLDTTFGGDGKVLVDGGTAGTDTAHAVALQSNGKIVVVGETWRHKAPRFVVTRLRSS